MRGTRPALARPSSLLTPRLGKARPPRTGRSVQGLMGHQFKGGVAAAGGTSNATGGLRGLGLREGLHLGPVIAPVGHKLVDALVGDGELVNACRHGDADVEAQSVPRSGRSPSFSVFGANRPALEGNAGPADVEPSGRDILAVTGRPRGASRSHSLPKPSDCGGGREAHSARWREFMNRGDLP